VVHNKTGLVAVAASVASTYLGNISSSVDRANMMVYWEHRSARLNKASVFGPLLPDSHRETYNCRLAGLPSVAPQRKTAKPSRAQQLRSRPKAEKINFCGPSLFFPPC